MESENVPNRLLKGKVIFGCFEGMESFLRFIATNYGIKSSEACKKEVDTIIQDGQNVHLELLDVEAICKPIVNAEIEEKRLSRARSGGMRFGLCN